MLFRNMDVMTCPSRHEEVMRQTSRKTPRFVARYLTVP